MAIVTDSLAAEWIGKLAAGASFHTNADADKATWYDNVASHDLSGTNFAWTTSSGWKGSGSAGDPYALQFKSSDTTYMLRTENIADPASVFSMEAWVSIPTSSPTNGIVNLYCTTDGTCEVFLRTTAAGLEQATYYDSMGDPWPAYSDNDLRNTGWHHLVLVFGSSHLHLYLDGGEEQDLDMTGYWPFTNCDALTLGCLAWATTKTDYLDGAIATVRLYTKALSSSEVSQNYAAGILAASTDSVGSNRSLLIQFGIA